MFRPRFLSSSPTLDSFPAAPHPKQCGTESPSCKLSWSKWKVRQQQMAILYGVGFPYLKAILVRIPLQFTTFWGDHSAGSVLVAINCLDTIITHRKSKYQTLPIAWRIIPVSKWLTPMVSKSPKWGYSPYKWPKWLINGDSTKRLVRLLDFQHNPWRIHGTIYIP